MSHPRDKLKCAVLVGLIVAGASLRVGPYTTPCAIVPHQ
jgi:hypothetical protein